MTPEPNKPQTPPETVQVVLSREEAEALLATRRGDAQLIAAQDTLRAALDQPAEERVEEFRVVGDKGTNRYGAADRERAKRNAAYRRSLGERNVRFQRSYEFRTPWEDIDDEH